MNTTAAMDKLLLHAVLPGTISMIFAEIGGFASLGAVSLFGADPGGITFRHPVDRGLSEVRGSVAQWNSAEGALAYSVGIDLPVNGRAGEDWHMVVSYDANRTYSVWLIARNFRSEARQELLDARSCIYAEDLFDAMDSMYDSALHEPVEAPI